MLNGLRIGTEKNAVKVVYAKIYRLTDDYRREERCENDDRFIENSSDAHKTRLRNEINKVIKGKAKGQWSFDPY
jgi:hypothetical protein